MRARLTRTLNRWPRRLSLSAKLLTLLAAMLVLSYSLTLNQFHRDMEAFGRQQLQVLGRAVTFQTALNSAPMILAQDWLSLNITLKQLTDDPLIEGAEVYDRHGKQLAQAGKLSTTVFEHAIELQDDTLGKVRVHLSTAPLERDLIENLRHTTLFAIVGGLLTLAALGLLARHFSTALRALTGAATDIAEGIEIQPLDEHRRDEFGEISRLLNRRFAPAIAEEPPLTQQLEQLARDLSEQLPETLPAEQPDRSDSDKLADAKPEQADDGAPGPAKVPLEASRLEGQPASTPTLTDADTYLLYIDHHSAASDSLPERERAQLLEEYRKTLEQVSQLYKGAVSEDPRGNWYVEFTPLSMNHSHGINALCAAQLFAGLYRGFNQQRIRHFSPVANMKVILVTGSPATALIERAAALGESLSANELITEQSLFEVPALNERLLAGGEYRKVDEQTYLLTQLCPDYQELIDRQVDHFLKQG